MNVQTYCLSKESCFYLWLGHGDNAGKKSKVVVVVVESIVFIFFFTSLLMLIPAAIFTAMENDEEGSWDYLNSVYYTFITLSTVGFGDMVPGTIDCKYEN